MGVWEQLSDWLGSRQDAAPLLLESEEEPRWDMVRRDPPSRADSTWNPLTFMGGVGDKGSVARPAAHATRLSDRDLERAYDNSGVSRRIVDLLPDEATRKGWSVPEVPGGEDQRLNVYETVADGGKMARLYGGAVGLMVTEDDIPRSVRGTRAFQSNPMSYLSEPLDLERVGSLLAFHIFDCYEAQPSETERDVRSPGYRLPRIWNFGADGISGRVHASRVIYFRGAKRPPSQSWGSFGRNNLMPDDSALQVLWDDIRGLIETAKGGRVLAQELSQNVLLVQELAPKQTGDEAGAFARVMARIQKSLGLLNMIVLGPGDKFEKMGTPATGYKDLSEGAQMMLSMALGWPRSMLSGEAPAGLSSDDSAGLERERKIVSSYQEQRLRRPLEQFYRVVYSAQDGPTRGEIPPEWALTFHPLNEPTDAETADLLKVIAETDTLNIRSGIYGPEVPAEQRYQTAGIVLDLVEVPIPDPDEEAAVAELRAELAAAGTPDGGNVATPPREDAADSVCLLVPAADPGLRAAVEATIGQVLAPEDAPHVTVLYVGSLAPEDLAEVVQVTTEEASRAMPGTVERGSVRAFPAGEDGKVPIVVEFSDSWALQGLHDVLLTRLAHLVSARQHRAFRPHATLGYAPAPLSAEALGALSGVDASGVRVPISAVLVQVGERVVATIPVGS